MDGSPSELPVFYGGRTADGELVKRPSEDNALGLASPSRTLQRRAASPDRTPMPPSVIGTEFDRPIARQRTRPSPYTRHSYAEERPSQERPSPRSQSSRRPARTREEEYYDDRDYDRDYDRYEKRYRREERDREFGRDREPYHPDIHERSRPPRSYRNAEYTTWARPRSYHDHRGDRPNSLYEERRDRESPPQEPLLAMTNRDSWTAVKRQISEDESLDGYNYGSRRRGPQINFKDLSPAEKAEVMRLPWSHWMNSDFKNRKSLFHGFWY
jgi:aquaporin related protein